MVSETREPGPIEVDRQRLISRAKGVDSHVELFAADQQRVADVPLDDVRFGLRTIWFPAEVVLPLGNLCQLVQQEDAFPL